MKSISTTQHVKHSSGGTVYPKKSTPLQFGCPNTNSKHPIITNTLAILLDMCDKR